MNTAEMCDAVRQKITAARLRIAYYQELEALQHVVLADLVALSFHERDTHQDEIDDQERQDCGYGCDEFDIDPSCERHL